jgi:hypothetical protein
MATASVHFSPGARTAWQTHPSAKPSTSPRATAYASVEAGQSRSSVPAIASSSSPARTGAAANRFMTHLAMQEVDEQGNPVTWGEDVTDEEYGAAPTDD